MNFIKLLKDLIIHFGTVAIVSLEEMLKFLDDQEYLGAHHLLLTLLLNWSMSFLRRILIIKFKSSAII